MDPEENKDKEIYKENGSIISTTSTEPLSDSSQEGSPLSSSPVSPRNEPDTEIDKIPSNPKIEYLFKKIEEINDEIRKFIFEKTIEALKIDIKEHEDHIEELDDNTKNFIVDTKKIIEDIKKNNIKIDQIGQIDVTIKELIDKKSEQIMNNILSAKKQNTIKKINTKIEEILASNEITSESLDDFNQLLIELLTKTKNIKIDDIFDAHGNIKNEYNTLFKTVNDRFQGLFINMLYEASETCDNPKYINTNFTMFPLFDLILDILIEMHNLLHFKKLLIESNKNYLLISEIADKLKQYETANDKTIFNNKYRYKGSVNDYLFDEKSINIKENPYYSFYKGKDLYLHTDYNLSPDKGSIILMNKKIDKKKISEKFQKFIGMKKKNEKEDDVVLYIKADMFDNILIEDISTPTGGKKRRTLKKISKQKNKTNKRYTNITNNKSRKLRRRQRKHRKSRRHKLR